MKALPLNLIVIGSIICASFIEYCHQIYFFAWTSLPSDSVSVVLNVFGLFAIYLVFMNLIEKHHGTFMGKDRVTIMMKANVSQRIISMTVGAGILYVTALFPIIAEALPQGWIFNLLNVIWQNCVIILILIYANTFVSASKLLYQEATDPEAWNRKSSAKIINIVKLEYLDHAKKDIQQKQRPGQTITHFSKDIENVSNEDQLNQFVSTVLEAVCQKIGKAGDGDADRTRKIHTFELTYQIWLKIVEKSDDKNHLVNSVLKYFPAFLTNFEKSDAQIINEGYAIVNDMPMVQGGISPISVLSHKVLNSLIPDGSIEVLESIHKLRKVLEKTDSEFSSTKIDKFGLRLCLEDPEENRELFPTFIHPENSPIDEKNDECLWKLLISEKDFAGNEYYHKHMNNYSTLMGKLKLDYRISFFILLVVQNKSNLRNFHSYKQDIDSLGIKNSDESEPSAAEVSQIATHVSKSRYTHLTQNVVRKILQLLSEPLSQDLTRRVKEDTSLSAEQFLVIYSCMYNDSNGEKFYSAESLYSSTSAVEEDNSWGSTQFIASEWIIAYSRHPELLTDRYLRRVLTKTLKEWGTLLLESLAGNGLIETYTLYCLYPKLVEMKIGSLSTNDSYFTAPDAAILLIDFVKQGMSIENIREKLVQQDAYSSMKRAISGLAASFGVGLNEVGSKFQKTIASSGMTEDFLITDAQVDQLTDIITNI